MPSLIEDVETFAAAAHAGQVDKAGQPYINHPRRVAAAVAAAGLDEEAVAAAWLHDVVEDCDVTLDEIEVRFGPQVAHLVGLLTRIPDMDKDVYYQRLRDDEDQRGVVIKKADIADNLDPERVSLLDPEMAERLSSKYTHALRVLSGEDGHQAPTLPAALTRPPVDWQNMAQEEKSAWSGDFLRAVKREQDS